MHGLTEKLADKLVFFLITLAIFLPLNQTSLAVAYISAAVFASALASYIDRPPIQAGLALAFIGFCLPYPELCFFLPLIALDCYATPWPWLAAAGAVPLATHAGRLGLATAIGLGLLVAVAAHVYRRTATLTALRHQTHALRDAARESALREARQREALLEKQDDAVRLATLGERNRIAREIHDHVGHQLASAILQLGALMAVCRDDTFKPALEQLKQTLAGSMEQIRSSVHDLHDQAIDLESEVRRMADAFRFCPLRLDYNIDVQPEAPVRYALLAIIQEGLANIIRHSGASEAQLTLREHPGFYQLILRDNGRGGAGRMPESAIGAGIDLTGDGLPLPRPGSAGIGLRNIAERVAGLGGQARFQTENGFTVFVTIPREASARRTP